MPATGLKRLSIKYAPGALRSLSRIALPRRPQCEVNKVHIAILIIVQSKVQKHAASVSIGIR